MTTVAHYEASNELLRERFAQVGFVTASDLMIPTLRAACKAAVASDVTILLEGETGTGKQVLARAIHQLDQKRASFPFVTAHCSSIGESLAESELFGHQRGAFTGAVGDRAGLFHSANHGTILLDDVSDLPLSIQPKLLDVIQRGIVRAVGSDRETDVNIRVIATSNQPLKDLVSLNRFRSDLYYRLNVIRLRLLPLRERSEDLPSLILAFAQQHREIYQPICGADTELIDFLRSHPFSGNVRELENSVLRMMFLKKHGASLTLADWLAQAKEDQSEYDRDPVGEAAEKLWEAITQKGLPYSQAIRETERKIIQAALRVGGRTRKEIALQLRTSERTLYHKIRAHGLNGQSQYWKFPS